MKSSDLLILLVGGALILYKPIESGIESISTSFNTGINSITDTIRLPFTTINSGLESVSKISLPEVTPPSLPVISLPSLTLPSFPDLSGLIPNIQLPEFPKLW